MAGDRRATSGNLISPPHHREGVPGRSPLRRRHRRRRRPGHGDGQALPAPARALREGRGLAPLPRGQGQPARPDGPQPPAGGHAGPRRRAALRRLRPRPGPGRLFQYDVTGGRYEESDFAATGSGQPPRRHRGQARLPAPTSSRDEAVDLALTALCSRPPTRTPPPAAPTSCAASSRSSPPSPPRASSGSPTSEIAERFAALLDVLTARESASGRSRDRHRHGGGRRHEHALLRRPRAGHEGPGRLRPQGHRPGPQPSSPPSTPTASCSAPRTRRPRCARSARSTTASPSPGVGKYNEFDQLRIAGVRHADLKGYSYSREDVDARSLANNYAQILGQVFTHEMKPLEVEILVAEVGPRPRPTTSSSTSSTTAPSWTRTASGRPRRRGRGHRRAPRGRHWRPRPRPWPRPWPPRSAALAGPDRTLGADELEVAVLDRNNGRRTFRRLTDDDVERGHRCRRRCLVRRR